MINLSLRMLSVISKGQSNLSCGFPIANRLRGPRRKNGESFPSHVNNSQIQIEVTQCALVGLSAFKRFGTVTQRRFQFKVV